MSLPSIGLATLPLAFRGHGVQRSRPSGAPGSASDRDGVTLTSSFGGRMPSRGSTSPSSSAMHALKRRSPTCRLRAVDNGIRYLFTAPRSPTTTGKVERLHNTMRAEFFTDGCRRDSIGWYSTTPTRPHQSLGMRPRAERFALPRAGVQRWVDHARVDPVGPRAGPGGGRRTTWCRSILRSIGLSCDLARSPSAHTSSRREPDRHGVDAVDQR